MEIRNPAGQIIRPSKWRSSKKGKAPYQGEFYPSNSQKYDGDVNKIVFRSAMELKMMQYLDLSPTVLSWHSEETVIPYVSPKDQKIHRYFLDMKATIKLNNGTTKTFLIEVKEEKSTRPPTLPKTGKKTNRFIRESMTYAVNMAKWTSAQQVCEEKGWKFQILTDKQLRF